jgi:hypothetical protein
MERMAKGRDLAALRYLCDSELTRKSGEGMDIHRENKKRGGGARRSEGRSVGRRMGVTQDRVF